MTRREQIEMKEAQAKEKEERKGGTVAKAKAKAKVTGKAKAKSKTEKSTASTEEEKSTEEEEVPADKPSTGLEDLGSGDDEDIQTPKKTLFASDDDADDADAQEPKPKRRRGSSKPAVKAAKGKSTEPDVEPVEPAEGENAKKPRRGKKAAAADSKNTKTPTKPRGRPPKNRSSPKLKATPKRRSKIAEHKARGNQIAALEKFWEDESMKKTGVAAMKSLTHHTFENLKKKLQSEWNKGFKESTLVIYWSRTAAGLKLKNEPGNPQIAYFGFKGRGAWNHRMTASFLAASLLAAWQVSV